VLNITEDKELLACTPAPVNPNLFNPHCTLPYGLTLEHIRQALEEFIDFLGFINQQLHAKGIPRLESFFRTFSGFSVTSRRTITASVNRSGTEKMRANWVYEDSGE